MSKTLFTKIDLNLSTAYRSVAILAILTVCTSTASQAYFSSTVFNDSPEHLTEIHADDKNLIGLPLELAPGRGSGIIDGGARRLPKSVHIRWISDKHGPGEATFPVRSLLPGSAAKRLWTIEYVYRGEGEMIVSFELTKGDHDYERIIPSESTAETKQRLLNERLADAARSGELTIMKAAIAEGAKITPEQFPDPSPLHNAVLSGSEEAVQLLVDHGAEIATGSGLLTQAIHVEDQEMAWFLLDLVADVNTGAPILEAASKGYTKVVEALLERGADPDQTELGQFPLVNAARNGHLDTLRVLLAAGADYRKRLTGETAAQLADTLGQREAAAFIRSWISEHGLEAPSESPALQHFESLRPESRTTGEYFRAAEHPRLSRTHYQHPDGWFRLDLGSVPFEIEDAVELNSMRGGTDARLASRNGQILVLLARELEGEDSRNPDLILSNIASSHRHDSDRRTTENHFRQTRNGRVLVTTVVNENYDPFYPAFYTGNTRVEELKSIGAHAYLARGKLLIEAFYVSPRKPDGPLDSAYEVAVVEMLDIVNGLEFVEK